MQQPAHMGGVVRDAERATDHLGDSAAGPDLAAEAVGFRSSRQQRRELGKLLGGESGLATRGGMAP
jgi:hypothetical protein